MLLHPSEVRARCEVLRKALKRLLGSFREDGDHMCWTRRQLFDSPSAQSHQLSWQRNVLRVLMDRRLVERIGPVKKPLYTVGAHPEGADAVSDRLAALVEDTAALEALLRERFEYGSREDVREDAPEEDNSDSDSFDGDDNLPLSDDQLDIAHLSEHEMLYVISRNVIYIREAVDECRQRIRRLEEAWLDPSTSSETAPTIAPATESKANGTTP